MRISDWSSDVCSSDLLDAIYEAPAELLLATLGQIEPGYRCIAIIGHNPGMEELAAMLVGGGDPQARQAMAEKYPTAGPAVIDFDCAGWTDVTPRLGKVSCWEKGGSSV